MIFLIARRVLLFVIIIIQFMAVPKCSKSPVSNEQLVEQDDYTPKYQLLTIIDSQSNPIEGVDVSIGFIMKEHIAASKKYLYLAALSPIT